MVNQSDVQTDHRCDVPIWCTKWDMSIMYQSGVQNETWWANMMYKMKPEHGVSIKHEHGVLILVYKMKHGHDILLKLIYQFWIYFNKQVLK